MGKSTSALVVADVAVMGRVLGVGVVVGACAARKLIGKSVPRILAPIAV
jgi:glutamate-1-semialdehyde aminotransferase